MSYSYSILGPFAQEKYKQIQSKFNQPKTRYKELNTLIIFDNDLFIHYDYIFAVGFLLGKVIFTPSISIYTKIYCVGRTILYF